MGLSPWLYGDAVYSTPTRYTNDGFGDAQEQSGAGGQTSGQGPFGERSDLPTVHIQIGLAQ